MTSARSKPAAHDSSRHSQPAHYVDSLQGSVAAYWYWIWGGLLLFPIWLPTYLVTEDGLAHLYWVEVYRALGSPDSALSPFFVRHLTWDAPYHLVHFGLQYGLATILEPHLAQKVVASLAVLGWVGAIYFLGRVMCGGLTLGAFAALLLIHSSWLYNGFFAFMGAMPLVLVAMGLLARLDTSAARANSPRSYVALGVVGLVAHYAHFFVGALFLMLGTAWLLFPWRPLRFNRVYLAAAMLPTGLLAVWYLSRGSLGGGGMKWEPFVKVVGRFVGLAFFRGLAAPTMSFWIALAAFGSVLAFLCWRGLRAQLFRDIRPDRRFVFLFVGLLTVVYFIAPATVGEAYPFHARLHFAALALLLPSLAPELSIKARRLVLAVVSVLLAWQVISFSAREMRFSNEYASMLRQTEVIPSGATVASSLLYGNARYEGSFVRILASLPEDVAFRRGAVLLNSFYPPLAYYWVRPRSTVTSDPDFRIDLGRGPRGLTFLIQRVP